MFFPKVLSASATALLHSCNHHSGSSPIKGSFFFIIHTVIFIQYLQTTLDFYIVLCYYKFIDYRYSVC